MLGIKNYNDGATGPRKKFDDILHCVFHCMIRVVSGWPVLRQRADSLCRLSAWFISTWPWSRLLCPVSSQHDHWPPGCRQRHTVQEYDSYVYSLHVNDTR